MLRRRTILVHCLALGGLGFFVLGEGPAAPAPKDDAPIVGAARIAGLARAHRVRFGEAPSDAELRALIEDATDTEILVREALRRGVHRTDPVIRRRLVDNMRFAAGTSDALDTAYTDEGDAFEAALSLGMHRADPLVRRRLAQRSRGLLVAEHAAAPVTAAEIDRYLQQHAGAHAAAARLTLRQVFLDRSRGDGIAQQAERLRQRLLRGEHGAEQAGDAPPVRLRSGSWSRRELSRRLGPTAAERIGALEAGRWSAPIHSPYGVHLVRVDATAEPAADRTAQRALAREVLRERRRSRILRAALDALRARHAPQLVAGPGGLASAERGT